MSILLNILLYYFLCSINILNFYVWYRGGWAEIHAPGTIIYIETEDGYITQAVKKELPAVPLTDHDKQQPMIYVEKCQCGYYRSPNAALPMYRCSTCNMAIYLYQKGIENEITLGKKVKLTSIRSL